MKYSRYFVFQFALSVFQHSSHALLQKNGFLQQVYSKYQARWLKKKKTTGTWGSAKGSTDCTALGAFLSKNFNREGKCTYLRAVNTLVEFVQIINNSPSLISLSFGFYYNSLEKGPSELDWVTPHQNLRNLWVFTTTLLPSLRFYTKLFPNEEYIFVQKEASDFGVFDSDLRLLWATRLKEASIWRETPHLEVWGLDEGNDKRLELPIMSKTRNFMKSWSNCQFSNDRKQN